MSVKVFDAIFMLGFGEYAGRLGRRDERLNNTSAVTRRIFLELSHCDFFSSEAVEVHSRLSGRKAL